MLTYIPYILVWFCLAINIKLCTRGDTPIRACYAVFPSLLHPSLLLNRQLLPIVVRKVDTPEGGEKVVHLTYAIFRDIVAYHAWPIHPCTDGEANKDLAFA